MNTEAWARLTTASAKFLPGSDFPKSGLHAKCVEVGTVKKILPKLAYLLDGLFSYVLQSLQHGCHVLVFDSIL